MPLWDSIVSIEINQVRELDDTCDVDSEMHVSLSFALVFKNSELHQSHIVHWWNSLKV
jgi:hypothetical protein